MNKHTRVMYLLAVALLIISCLLAAGVTSLYIAGQHHAEVVACESENARAAADEATWDEYIRLLLSHSNGVTSADRQVAAGFEHRLAIVDAPRRC